MSIMGLPKRLTEMQMKFAQELVTNEGRKTPTECAVEAGYDKDTAHVRASELRNPKKYPLVVKKSVVNSKSISASIFSKRSCPSRDRTRGRRGT